jgi:hypothetical protein
MGICFALFAALIAALFVGVHVRFSEICVDDDKICAWRFGLPWKCIRWEALRQIMKVTEFDLPSNAPRTLYYLMDSTRTRNFHIRTILQNTRIGAVVFDDRLIGLPELVHIVNHRVAMRDVEIVAVDRMAESRAGRTLWASSTPRMESGSFFGQCHRHHR